MSSAGRPAGKERSDPASRPHGSGGPFSAAFRAFLKKLISCHEMAVDIADVTQNDPPSGKQGFQILQKYRVEFNCRIR